MQMYKFVTPREVNSVELYDIMEDAISRGIMTYPIDFERCVIKVNEIYLNIITLPDNRMFLTGDDIPNQIRGNRSIEELNKLHMTEEEVEIFVKSLPAE